MSASSATYQAILVLLPKLTNAPTKVHTGCLAHWVLCCTLLLCTIALLYCADHYTSSTTFTHTSVSNICTYHFYWGYPKWKNMWNKWKNHFSEMKGDVGMSPHEKEREQEDTYTKTRNSFITPSLHLCFFLIRCVAICCLWIRILHALQLIPC